MNTNNIQDFGRTRTFNVVKSFSFLFLIPFSKLSRIYTQKNVFRRGRIHIDWIGDFDTLEIKLPKRLWLIIRHQRHTCIECIWCDDDWQVADRVDWIVSSIYQLWVHVAVRKAQILLLLRNYVSQLRCELDVNMNYIFELQSRNWKWIDIAGIIHDIRVDWLTYAPNMKQMFFSYVFVLIWVGRVHFLFLFLSPQLLSPSVTSPETRAWNYMLFPFVATESNGWKVVFAGGVPLSTRPNHNNNEKKSNLIDGNIRNEFRLKMILHAPIKRFVELDFFSVEFFSFRVNSNIWNNAMGKCACGLRSDEKPKKYNSIVSRIHSVRTIRDPNRS